MDDTKDSYFKFIVVFLLFLLFAFDRDLALIYLLILVGDYFWYKSDSFISFKIKRQGSSLIKVVLETLAALGLFLGASTVLINIVSPQTLVASGFIKEAQSIFHLLATGTPILQGSKILTLVGWGVLVPIVETTFFNGRLLEGLAHYSEKVFGTKVRLDKVTPKLFLVILVVASLFTLFHITAKGLNSLPLLITFIFSIISSLLVIRHQELRGAIYLHVIVNSMAVLSSFGWI